MDTKLDKNSKTNKLPEPLTGLDSSLPEVRVSLHFFKQHRLEDPVGYLLSYLEHCASFEDYAKHAPVLANLTSDFYYLMLHWNGDKEDMYSIKQAVNACFFTNQLERIVACSWLFKKPLRYGKIMQEDEMLLLTDLQMAFLKALLLESGSENIVSLLDGVIVPPPSLGKIQ